MATTNQAVLAEILGMIEDIEGVGLLWLGSIRPEAGAGEYPICWLRPIKWEDQDQTDDQTIERTLWFEVSITGRGDGGCQALDELDQLANAITAAVDLAEIPETIPARTLLSRGRYEAQAAEERMVIEGTISFYV